MDPLSVSITVGRPREDVFDYLADIANHPEFLDHFIDDFHLTREDTVGRGAGARFRVRAPLNRFSWADMTFAEVQPPYRIVARGRGGKFNRIKMMGIWEIHQGAGSTSRVDYTYETVPVLPSDHVMELFGGRAWTRRRAAKGMRRLRAILEDGRQRGKHVTTAAG